MPNREIDEFLKQSEIVRRQIVSAEVKDKSESEGLSFLNNFHCNLPYGDIISRESRRQHCEIYSVMDLLVGDHMGKYGITQNDENFSDLLWSQTYRRFFQNIDECMEKLGIPLELILGLLRERHEHLQSTTWQQKRDKEHDYSVDIEILDRLDQILLPVYIELRVMGYSDTDLTS
jgi:hypothetical protein